AADDGARDTGSTHQPGPGREVASEGGKTGGPTETRRRRVPSLPAVVGDGTEAPCRNRCCRCGRMEGHAGVEAVLPARGRPKCAGGGRDGRVNPSKTGHKR